MVKKLNADVTECGACLLTGAGLPTVAYFLTGACLLTGVFFPNRCCLLTGAVILRNIVKYGVMLLNIA